MSGNLAVCTSDTHNDLHKHWLDHKVSEAASGTMRWLCNYEESALCSTMHEESERRKEEENSAQVETGWWHLVISSCWGGQHSDAHEWLGEHAPGGKQEADISLVGGRWARSHKSLEVTLSFPRDQITDWSLAKTDFSENLFPYNKLSFSPAWSTWAGLISNNPPATP